MPPNKLKEWEKSFDKQFKRYWRGNAIPDEIKFFIKSKRKEEIESIVGEYKEALIWCSGSDDFQVGGKAREGWEKICVPLLKSKISEE